MSGKQSKDLAVPTWFLPAIDLLYHSTENDQDYRNLDSDN